jgi:hypothetical protein
MTASRAFTLTILVGIVLSGMLAIASAALADTHWSGGVVAEDTHWSGGTILAEDTHWSGGKVLAEDTHW